MASISVSENDFTILAGAAIAAQRRGDRESALTLDKLARKANAALTSAKRRTDCGPRIFGQVPPCISWRDVPSVLEQFEPQPLSSIG